MNVPPPEIVVTGIAPSSPITENAPVCLYVAAPVNVIALSVVFVRSPLKLNVPVPEIASGRLSRPVL